MSRGGGLEMRGGGRARAVATVATERRRTTMKEPKTERAVAAMPPATVGTKILW